MSWSSDLTQGVLEHFVLDLIMVGSSKRLHHLLLLCLLGTLLVEEVSFVPGKSLS